MSLYTKQNLWGDDIPWLYGLREKGARAFIAAGLPDAENEDWKYSWFAEPDLQSPQFDTSPYICDGQCHHEHKNDFPAYVITFCNGKPETEHGSFPDGVTVKSLAEAIFDDEAQRYINKSFNMEKFPFAALNTAYIEQGIFISVENSVIVDKPIVIRYCQHCGVNRFCNIRNLIVAGNSTALKIIEDFGSVDGAVYFDNVVNEIYVGAGSRVEHYKKQHESALAHHVALNSIKVRRDGNYRFFGVQEECRLARNETLVDLLQSGASAEVNGVYRLGGNGVSDFTCNINHLAERTFSNQLVKGTVAGNAKGVFQGRIHIEPSAQKCEGYQLHKALLLNDNAEICCKPELEIFADDVKCSHGASCGALDAEQLFYLQARGVDEREARRILCNAYLQEVFYKINDQEISEWLNRDF